MMKAFLSHSSSDKASYISIVSQKLLPNVEYDELTFEEGMGNLEEILKSIDRSDLFVLFISDSSLESKWVIAEVLEAKRRIDAGLIKRFFPIIIDKGIRHDDPRIPEWIKENYNLRPITRPVVAAKRIRERLTEISWESHPKLRAKNQIFVGRNDLIKTFEERLDDFSRDQPIVTFVSGLRDIGRKSLIVHSLKKANLVRDTYVPIRIDLLPEDSIEIFIQKLADVGISDELHVFDLLTTSLEEKIEICAKILNQIFEMKEMLLIEDRFCLIRHEGSIPNWFQSVIEKLTLNTPSIFVASSLRPDIRKFVRDDRYFFLQAPELERAERDGLFRRYSELLNLEIEREDMQRFSSLLSGFPGQVKYAVSLVESEGLDSAMKRSDEIVSYATQKSSILIREFLDSPKKLDFLRFLAGFDFISLDFILDIEATHEEKISDYLDEFIGVSIVEMIGDTGQYFRVNDVIRDFILRDRFALNDFYKQSLTEYAQKFVHDYNEEYYDVSEYQIAIKEALTSNLNVPDSLLTPAHFLKSMKELYSQRRYRDVVSLANRVLEKAEFYEKHTSQDVRYYLCQSLARLGDRSFLSEVQLIEGPEHNFLLGFYYRLQGRDKEALVRFEKALADRKNEQRARREMVSVLGHLGQYDRAYSLAQENFDRYPSNPILGEALFNCIRFSSFDQEKKNVEMEKCLNSIKAIQSPRSEEIYCTSLAKFQFDNEQFVDAFQTIDDAIDQYTDSIYPLLTKLEMASISLNPDRLNESLNAVKKSSHSKNASLVKRAVQRAEARSAALNGSFINGKNVIEEKLKYLGPTNQAKLIEKLKSMKAQ